MVGKNVLGGIDYIMLQPVRETPEKVAENVVIAASDSHEYESSGLDGYSAMVITANVTYSAAATSGVRVRWLYSPDGTNYDSPDAADNEGNYQDIYFSAGETVQETLLVPIFKPYVKIQVYNRDGAEAVTLNGLWVTLLR